MSSQIPNFESALHEALGMTDDELSRELVESGLDPASECEAIRRMILLNVERAAARPEPERRLAELLFRGF